MTVLDLIKSSLRLIGAIASGETPSSAESTDALATLNDLIQSWSNDGFLINSKVREVLSLVSSQSSYTIGLTTGNFDTIRPELILGASLIASGSSVETPLEIISFDEYKNISNKSLTGTPQKICYNPTAPLGTVIVWPAPLTTESLVLYSLKPLTQYTSTSTTLALPTGYSRALKYNLALELAPEYGKMVNEVIASIANESKTLLMRANTSPVLMRSDLEGITQRKTFNWQTGE